MTAPNVVDPLYAWKGSQWRDSPCRTNRASQLGGPCERELVYWRTRWNEAEKPSRDLQVIFAEGTKHERAVLVELLQAGVPILEQQSALEWAEYEISGHVDAVLVHEGAGWPLEVKSMNGNIWGGIFRRGPGVYSWAEVAPGFTKKPWLRKYRGQVTIYALLKHAPGGVMLFLNKDSGAVAQVDVPLDPDYAAELVERAARVNAHVREGTLPERIEYDEEVCPRCPFYGVCLPDQVGKDPLAFVPEPKIEALLEARERSAEAAAAFEQADSRVKAWAKARAEERLVVGCWLLVKKPHGNGVRVEVTRTSAPAAAAVT